ncbi:MAG: polysaccharide deacetylase family protein [Gammaproteobacteria bacterium]
MHYNSPGDRIEYRPIIDRDPLPLPDGAKVIVWPCLNIEHWPVDRPMPRTIVDPPAHVANTVPDIPNWTWHEYGQRVAFWRMRRIFEEYGVRPTIMLGGSVCDAYPQVVDACLESGWDFAGHGWIQRALPAEDDQRAVILRTFERITEYTGRPPRGWLGPALAETHETVDWLRETGFEYVGDWILDDQPVDIATTHGTLVAMPYTQEHNDLATILIQGHKSSEYSERVIASLSQYLSEADEATRVLCFTLHPFIMGVPHRIRHLREILDHITNRNDVKIWTGSEILDWYRECKGRQDT